MEEIVVFVLIGAAVLTTLAMFWYLILTVRIIWAYNSLLAIAAVFFSPFVHIFFYFMPKDNFDKHEAGLFKKYFLSIGLIALLGIVAAIIIPTTKTQDSFSAAEHLSVDELSVDKLESLANQGDPIAQVNLGVMYNRGDRVVKDNVKAVELFQKAAEQGNSYAQYNLGVSYDTGRGIRQDYTKAVEWFQKSAEQGNSGGEYYLGIMYSNGKGVRQDYAKAAELYQKAADKGDADAQINLGEMYYAGKGIRQDYTKAVEWFQKAAEQGNSYAQYNLGVMYSSGEGVRQDYIQAKELYGKACDNGLQVGCDEYRELN
ncbi:tetratricopeptide repeat protein [Psychrobacter faecalis]